MNNQRRWILLGTAAAVMFALGWKASCLFAQSQSPTRLRSKVMTWDEAKTHTDKWGEMRTYFTGQTSGTTNMFTAVAVVKPGESVHPAHRHAEEEFLVLTEGSGVWHLNSQEFPAKKGDVLYVEPWDFHGLVNTGSTPLTFFVVRWNNQGIAPPPTPAGDHGH